MHAILVLGYPSRPVIQTRQGKVAKKINVMDLSPYN